MNVRLIAAVAAALLLSACQTATELPGGSSQSVDAGDGAEVVPPLDPYQQIQHAVAAEARQRFRRAGEYMQLQDWPAAVVELQWLTANYPDLSGPFLNLAMVYEQLTELELADENYRKALQANKLNLQAYNRYGLFLRRQGRFADAEQAYLKAIAIWQQDADSHRNLGILYELYMGRLSEALLQYQAYLQLLETGPEPEQGSEQAQNLRQARGWIIDLQRRLPAQES